MQRIVGNMDRNLAVNLAVVALLLALAMFVVALSPGICKAEFSPVTVVPTPPVPQQLPVCSSGSDLHRQGWMSSAWGGVFA